MPRLDSRLFLLQAPRLPAIKIAGRYYSPDLWANVMPGVVRAFYKVDKYSAGDNYLVARFDINEQPTKVEALYYSYKKYALEMYRQLGIKLPNNG